MSCFVKVGVGLNIPAQIFNFPGGLKKFGEYATVTNSFFMIVRFAKFEQTIELEDILKKLHFFLKKIKKLIIRIYSFVSFFVTKFGLIGSQLIIITDESYYKS